MDFEHALKNPSDDLLREAFVGAYVFFAGSEDWRAADYERDSWRAIGRYLSEEAEDHLRSVGAALWDAVRDAVMAPGALTCRVSTKEGPLRIAGAAGGQAWIMQSTGAPCNDQWTETARKALADAVAAAGPLAVCEGEGELVIEKPAAPPAPVQGSLF